MKKKQKMEGHTIKKLRAQLEATEERLYELEYFLLHEHSDIFFYRCELCEKVKYLKHMIPCDKEEEEPHKVCDEHKTRVWKEDDICPKCIQIREKRAKETIISFLHYVKRSECHKNVYYNIFVPLMKKIYQKAWRKHIWDEP